jgi:tRNA threonylcarbamoyladenosine biosynthesis protein TsaB
MPRAENPRLLVIETSGRVGRVALAEGATIVAGVQLDETRRHARDLAPAVAGLLDRQGWKPRDVQALFVSRGPGSYTGLRVGIMSAKAFAYATGCSLIAVDTFAAIARQMPTSISAVDVLDDAQQDRVYVQSFLRVAETGEMQAATPLGIVMFDQWLAQRANNHAVAGPALEKLRSKLPDGVNVSGPETWNPRTESIMRLGLARWQAGQSEDIYDLEPLYLRPSAAEEKWKDRK